MKIHSVRKLLTAITALSLLATANLVHSSIDGARLVGLAMHQEVGRNIYIGAIHYNSQIPVPADIVEAAGPKAMEYRVVARRTSIRSLMGSILLQGELATGNAPSGNTIEFAGNIMAAVKGSLYTGDSLTITLNSSNTLIAALDGQELARSSNRDVADYLLMGWVSERGPSEAFRRSILSEDIDSTLMSAYAELAVSAERIAVVTAWNAPVETPKPAVEPVQEIIAAAVPEQQVANAEEQSIATTEVSEASVVSELSDTVEADAVPIEVDGESNATLLASAAGSNLEFVPSSAPTLTPSEPIQVASLTLTREMIEPDSEAINTGEAIDAIEYSQRLAAFNNNVMRSVYAKIRYPKAAVRRNIQGKLELDLTVARDGSLLSVAVALTSGNNLLDKSALKAANSAFSSTPIADIDSVSIAEYGEAGDTLLIPVPISFVLTD